MAGLRGRTSLLGIIDQGIVSLANFATLVLLGRIAGPVALGEYALAFTVIVLLIAVQESFVAAPYTVIYNRLSGRSQDRLLASFLVLAVLIAGLSGLLLAGVGPLVFGTGPLSGLAPIATALALAAPMALVSELVRRLALAHLQMSEALRIDVLSSAVRLVCLGVLVASGLLSSYTALLAIALGGLGGAAVWLVSNRHRLRVAWGELPGHWRMAGRLGRWLGAARVTSVAHSYAVPWLLGILVGLEVVGGFSAAFGLIAATNPMLMGLVNVLGPRLARTWTEGGAAAVRRSVWRSTIQLTAVTAALAVCIALLARPLLDLVYGAEYTGYAGVVAVLALSLVVSLAGTPADHGLRTLHRPSLSFLASLCGLAATVSATFLLVPRLGAIGGAWALALGGSISCFVRIMGFDRLTRKPAMAMGMTMDAGTGAAPSGLGIGITDG